MDWFFCNTHKKKSKCSFLMVNTQGNRQCVDKTYFSGGTKCRGPEYTQGFNMMNHMSGEATDSHREQKKSRCSFLMVFPKGIEPLTDP